jgi:hypothetical protein
VIGNGNKYLSIAWGYPGQELEVVPAYFSQMIRPAWPATCELDSECDDGVCCNGKLSYQSTFLVCVQTRTC